MKFYTLLHIAEKEVTTMNNKAKSFTDQIKIYANCIKLLHLSLSNQQYQLSVITNNKEFVASFFEGFAIEIIELKFMMKVPAGVNFYSAHYKIEIYKYFASLDEKYVALIDSDVVCINKMPLSFLSCIENGIPLYYDITNQIHPVFGVDVILEDKKKVDKETKIGLWAGGEFISGTPGFFKILYDQIEEFSPAYFDNINKFHHQGDEFLNSIAIENGILNKKYVLFDAGTLSIIGRYWNYPTIHSQPSLEFYRDHFLLHLPSSKKLLAGLNTSQLRFDNLFGSLKLKMSLLYLINNIKSRIRKIRS